MSTDQTFQNAKSAGHAAAMWWASVLRDPKLDSGDDNPMMAALIAMSKDTMPKQSTDGLEQFANILGERLNQRLDGSGSDVYTSRYGITLGVDYHPDVLLQECAEQAGLRTTIADWPWKTVMWVKPDEVSVSYGYRAETQIIWTKSS